MHNGLDTVLVNARLETFERDMTIERVNLKQLVQEVVTEHKRLLITNGVFPVVSIDENFHRGDRSKMDENCHWAIYNKCSEIYI